MSKDFKKLSEELQEEMQIDKIILMTSYAASVMSGTMCEILKEKGIITDEDFKRIEKAATDAASKLKESYDNIGKNGGKQN